MKKTLVIMLSLVLVVLLAACGPKEPPVSGVPNPMHESTEQEIAEQLGLSLAAPEEAADVAYFIIDGDPQLAEMDFTLDGVAYCYRMAACAESTEIDGMHVEWKNSSEAAVDYNTASVCWNDDAEGLIRWFDVVPGIQYSLTVNEGASEELLVNTANLLFTPAQGDSDGDFAPVFTSLLSRIQSDYHFGVAGSSLTAVALAAEAADMFIDYVPTADDVKAALADFSSALAETDKEAAKLFPEQLGAIGSAFADLTGEKGAEVLTSSGYEAKHAPWSDIDLSEHFAALENFRAE